MYDSPSKKRKLAQVGSVKSWRASGASDTYLLGAVAVLVEDAHVPALGGGQPVALDDVAHHDAGRAHVCNRIPRYTPPRP